MLLRLLYGDPPRLLLDDNSGLEGLINERSFWASDVRYMTDASELDFLGVASPPQSCGGVDEPRDSVTAPSAHTMTPPVVAGDPAASSHTMQASPITMPSVVPEL